LDKELQALSRKILEVTLHLPDGQVLKGRGRDVPATMEHLYDSALHLTPRRHVNFVGLLNPGIDRYRGAYKVQFGYRLGDSNFLDEIVRAEVVGPE
jgi:hypothetical protein